MPLISFEVFRVMLRGILSSRNRLAACSAVDCDWYRLDDVDK